MENTNDERIVLKFGDPFEFHRLRDTKQKNPWNNPIPSITMSSCCNTENIYKKYYEQKNSWVEVG